MRGRTAAVIDDALKNNMVRAYRKVLTFLHPSARTLLSTLLGRWDVFNIKTILRGAHNHVSLDEHEDELLPGRAISAKTNSRRSRKFDDVGAVIDTMAMWGLRRTRRRCGARSRATPQDNDLAPLELALDQQYAEWAAARLVGEARRRRGRAQDPRHADRHGQPGHGVSARSRPTRSLQWPRSTSSKVGASVRQEPLPRAGAALRRRRGARPSQAHAVRRRARRGSAALPRERVDPRLRACARRPRSCDSALHPGVRDPHGVGVAIAYLFGKQNEITNLRIIVKGKAVGMPADRVREELILV